MNTITDLGDIRGKRVLVRTDFNVPLDGGTITDDGRVRAALPTITQLIEAGAVVILTAHLGRPKGQVDPAYSLAPVARRLGELLGQDVTLAPDVVGPGAAQAVSDTGPGQVVLLENIRFDARETSKDETERGALADDLAALAEAFVSDGFGVVHRKQASVYEVATRLPSAMGGLVQREVSALQRATQDPARPYVVVLGGSKVSDKLGVIENLLSKADTLLIGGGMVFTFLAAQGHEVGKSLLEADQVRGVQGYLRTAAERGVQIVLPTDIVVAPEFSAEATPMVVAADAMPADQIGLDIGPDSAGTFAAEIRRSRTVVWNGPMGVFEFGSFAGGTKAVARAMVEATGDGAFSIVGGGDSAAAVRTLGFDEAGFSHISTGGGASLEFLEGKELPGIQVLTP